MKALGIIVLIFALSIPTMLLGGVVFSDLWKWFIVPVFGAPPLTYMQAIGVLFVIGFIKIGMAMTPQNKEEIAEAPVTAIVSQSLALAIGYLIAWGFAAILTLFM